jgi:hypothetical protein
MATALARWAAVRSSMGAMYGTLEGSEVDHDLFKHPFAGKFDLVQGTTFMRWHVRHHAAQVVRTLRALGH